MYLFKQHQKVWSIGSTNHNDLLQMTIYTFKIIEIVEQKEIIIENYLGNRLSVSANDLFITRKEAIRTCVLQLNEILRNEI